MFRTILLFSFLISTSVFGQNDFFQVLADSSYTLTEQRVQYDPSYFSLDYPNGDVPANKGVCTDVIFEPIESLG